jgi:hypothetical protein
VKCVVNKIIIDMCPVSNNCGIEEQRYTGLQDCAISARARHTEEICLGPESSKRA